VKLEAVKGNLDLDS